MSIEAYSFEEELEFLFQMIYGNFEIPLQYISAQGMVRLELKQEGEIITIQREERLLRQRLAAFDPSFIKPVILTTALGELYILLQLERERTFQGTLLMGPVRSAPFNQDLMRGLLIDNQLPSYLREELLDQSCRMKIMSKPKLVQASLLLHHLFYREYLEVGEVGEQSWEAEIQEMIPFTANVDYELTDRRPIHNFHNDSTWEHHLLRCIREGKTEEVLKVYADKPITELGILSKQSLLRHQKNGSIVAITLATRAAIQGGLHTEIAYSLSDLFIQHIEELNRIQDLHSFTQKLIMEFTERVHRGKTQRYSKAVNSCLHFIFIHLYEKITLAKLAEVVQLNPSYLSDLFKKEVGMTFSMYVRQERISEAKNLLLHTRLPLSEISSRLLFSDQSHFTRIFNQTVGQTPKSFRTTQYLSGANPEPSDSGVVKSPFE